MFPIFISTSFYNMGTEHDVLHNKVMNLLKPLENEYGEKIILADFSWETDMLKDDWGEKVSSRLDIIDNYEPCFIAFIGNGYDPAPSFDKLKLIAKQRNIKLYNPISINELEITHAALSKTSNRSNCFFYFRKDIDITSMPEEYAEIYQPQKTDKADLLKKKIASIYGADQIREYEVHWDGNRLVAEESLSDRIFSDISSMIRKKYSREKEMKQFEIIRERMESYSRNYPFDIAEQSNICNKVLQEIYRSRFINVYGPVNYLHNCFLAQSIHAMQKKQEKRVACYFCDNVATDGNNREQFVNYVRSWSESLGKDNGYIFVGNIDIIYNPTEISDPNFFIKKLNKKIHLIATSDKAIKCANVTNIEMPKFSQKEKVYLIRSVLKSNFKSDDYGIAKILCNKRSSQNPVYLKHALDILLHTVTDDLKKLRTDKEIKSFIQQKALGIPDSLETILTEYELKAAPENIKRAVSYLDSSHGGLRYDDIEALLKNDGMNLTKSEWDSFCVRIEGAIHANQDGHIINTLSGFKSTFESDIKEYQKRLFDYVSNLDPESSVYKQNYLYLLLCQDGHSSEKRFAIDKILTSLKGIEAIRYDNDISQFYLYIKENTTETDIDVSEKYFALVRAMTECHLNNYSGIVDIDQSVLYVYYHIFHLFYHWASKTCISETSSRMFADISFSYCRFCINESIVADEDFFTFTDYHFGILDLSLTSLIQTYKKAPDTDSFNNVIWGYNEYISLCAGQYIFCYGYERVGEETIKLIEKKLQKFIYDAPDEYKNSPIAIEALRSIQE